MEDTSNNACPLPPSAHSLGPEVIRGQFGIVDLHHQPSILRFATQDLEVTKGNKISLFFFITRNPVDLLIWKHQNLKRKA